MKSKSSLMSYTESMSSFRDLFVPMGVLSSLISWCGFRFSVIDSFYIRELNKSKWWKSSERHDKRGNLFTDRNCLIADILVYLGIIPFHRKRSKLISQVIINPVWTFDELSDSYRKLYYVLATSSSYPQ